jgi:hypothetical protein
MDKDRNKNMRTALWLGGLVLFFFVAIFVQQIWYK